MSAEEQDNTALRGLKEQFAALQHIIECADTPLMRDVLAERDRLKEQVQTLEREKVELELACDHHRMFWQKGEERERGLKEQYDKKVDHLRQCQTKYDGLEEQLEALEISRDSWRSDAEVFQYELYRLKEQLQSTQVEIIDWKLAKADSDSERDLWETTLKEELEAWQEIAESSRDWRKSDEFIGLMVRARVPKEWPE
jgi:chromosome segregation ATPase